MGDRHKSQKIRSVNRSAPGPFPATLGHRPRESDGSRLFGHTTVGYGSNLRVAHALENCPTLIAGGGSGIKLGHNVVLPKGTPLCNAWLTLLRGSGN